MTRAVQHSSKSVEHYGPDYLGILLLMMFGRAPDLDPASCPQANLLIRAQRFYTAQDNGLDLPWYGKLYVNPPGGRISWQGRKVNQAALWYATLAHRFELGLIDEAIFMVFNLELSRHAQAFKVRQPFTFPHVMPKRRIDFWQPGPIRHFADIDGQGTPGELAIPIPQGSPGHSNAIIYMGSNVKRFVEVFGNPLPGTEYEGGCVYGI